MLPNQCRGQVQKVVSAAMPRMSKEVKRLEGNCNDSEEYWRPFGDKVGGKNGPMLVSRDGSRLLKPLDQGSASQREVEAYQILRVTPLGSFFSGFHGIQTVADQCYMELDCAIHGMRRPIAIIDVKLGRKIWEHDAPAEKIADQEKKIDSIHKDSRKDGFRVSAMSAGDLKLNKENLQVRNGVLTEEFGAWLLPAFFAVAPGYGALPEGPTGSSRPDDKGCTVDTAAARATLEQLQRLAAAAESGFGGVLRSSSVLVAREMRSGGTLVVRLIDLAKFTPYEASNVRDSNLCCGLKNLIKTWSIWCSSL